MGIEKIDKDMAIRKRELIKVRRAMRLNQAWPRVSGMWTRAMYLRATAERREARRRQRLGLGPKRPNESARGNNNRRTKKNTNHREPQRRSTGASPRRPRRARETPSTSPRAQRTSRTPTLRSGSASSSAASTPSHATPTRPRAPRLGRHRPRGSMPRPVHPFAQSLSRPGDSHWWDPPLSEAARQFVPDSATAVAPQPTTIADFTADTSDTALQGPGHEKRRKRLSLEAAVAGVLATVAEAAGIGNNSKAPVSTASVASSPRPPDAKSPTRASLQLWQRARLKSPVSPARAASSPPGDASKSAQQQQPRRPVSAAASRSRSPRTPRSEKTLEYLERRRLAQVEAAAERAAAERESVFVAAMVSGSAVPAREEIDARVHTLRLRLRAAADSDARWGGKPALLASDDNQPTRRAVQQRGGSFAERRRRLLDATKSASARELADTLSPQQSHDQESSPTATQHTGTPRDDDGDDDEDEDDGGGSGAKEARPRTASPTKGPPRPRLDFAQRAPSQRFMNVMKGFMVPAPHALKRAASAREHRAVNPFEPYNGGASPSGDSSVPFNTSRRASPREEGEEVEQQPQQTASVAQSKASPTTHAVMSRAGSRTATQHPRSARSIFTFEDSHVAKSPQAAGSKKLLKRGGKVPAYDASASQAGAIDAADMGQTFGPSGSVLTVGVFSENGDGAERSLESPQPQQPEGDGSSAGSDDGDHVWQPTARGTAIRGAVSSFRSTASQDTVSSRQKVVLWPPQAAPGPLRRKRSPRRWLRQRKARAYTAPGRARRQRRRQRGQNYKHGRVASPQQSPYRGAQPPPSSTLPVGTAHRRAVSALDTTPTTEAAAPKKHRLYGTPELAECTPRVSTRTAGSRTLSESQQRRRRSRLVTSPGKGARLGAQAAVLGSLPKPATSFAAAKLRVLHTPFATILLNEEPAPTASTTILEENRGFGL